MTRPKVKKPILRLERVGYTECVFCKRVFTKHGIHIHLNYCKAKPCTVHRYQWGSCVRCGEPSPPSYGSFSDV